LSGVSVNSAKIQKSQYTESQFNFCNFYIDCMSANENPKDQG
jgi:hypothetical protein